MKWKKKKKNCFEILKPQNTSQELTAIELLSQKLGLVFNKENAKVFIDKVKDRFLILEAKCCSQFVFINFCLSKILVDTF